MNIYSRAEDPKMCVVDCLWNFLISVFFTVGCGSSARLAVDHSKSYSSLVTLELISPRSSTHPSKTETSAGNHGPISVVSVIQKESQYLSSQ